MGQKLSNAPVYYTVAQVQFNPVLDFDSFLSIIQSQMRAHAFPDFREESYQRLVFPFGAADAGSLSTSPVRRQSRYSFGDIQGTSNFFLEANSLTFQTTHYETYEVFSGNFIKGLEIVARALSLAFFERIGVRYLDAVYPINPGETLASYLVPEACGLFEKLEGDLIQSYSETVTHIRNSQLVTRVIIRDGAIGLPEDLATAPPRIDNRFANWNGIHAIIDTDASKSGRNAFDIDLINKNLEDLHTIVSASFKSTVTEHAQKSWL